VALDNGSGIAHHFFMKQGSGIVQTGFARLCWVIAISACLYVFAPQGTAWAGQMLRVGVLAHRGEDVAVSRWQPTFQHLSQVLDDLDFRIVPLSLQGMNTALETGQLDLILTNPGHYHLIARTQAYSPLVTVRTDRKGQPTTGNRFGSVIFVRSGDDSIAGLVDLKGKKLGAVAPDAFGGFLIAANTLLANGINPWNDLDGISYYGFPQDRIVKAVLSGDVAAGIVRTGVLESMIGQKEIQPGDLRVLNPVKIPGFDLKLSTSLSPEWLLAAAVDVPDRSKRDIVLALLSLSEDDAAVMRGGYAGWNTVSHDGNVRALIETIEAAASASAAPSASFNMLLFPALALGAGILVTVTLRQRRRNGARTLGQDPARPDMSGPEIPLTPREQEILLLVEKGLTSKQIARDLGISPKTVEYHRGHLMRKYEAQNMTEVVSKAAAAVQT